MNNKELIKEILTSFTDEVAFLFNTDLNKAFLLSIYILKCDRLPYFKNLSEEDNTLIEDYFNRFKELEYRPSEMRRAFQESYLLSLRDLENYEVKTTPELPLIYLKNITEAIAENLEFEHINILNASGNIGSLASSIRTTLAIKDEDFLVTVNDEDELNIASTLRDFTGFNYEITSDLPEMDYRADIIVSDPFLRSVEDDLIFFEDYNEYLNYNGYMVLTLTTDFVRSRVFSDVIEKHSLILLGLIEYPFDLLGGLIKSSIVILHKKKEPNTEFFHAEMPSIKKVDENMQVIENVKKYLTEYMDGLKK